MREARLIAKGLKSPHHPILAHIVPIRRCNLSCSYCNEYDKVSNPVAAEEMLRRIDLLAALGTAAITISGGEPLLHPDLDDIIRRIRTRGMLAGVITNGYLLTPERIEGFNRAGLDQLQISIDNVMPDEVSKKSLKVLDKKLQWLSEYAEFEVNINSVLGSSIRNADDALVIARRARELRLESTVGLIHDSSGQSRPLDLAQRSAYESISTLQRPFYTSALYDRYQKNIVSGVPNQWHCRAGSRYLYICENGLVHYCSQQRGFPGVPLKDYTREDIDREYRTTKSCAPFCTISCVQRVAMIDEVREQPVQALSRFFPPKNPHDPLGELPFGLKVLTWLFLPCSARNYSTQKSR